jgi:cold shock CspA family protein
MTFDPELMSKLKADEPKREFGVCVKFTSRLGYGFLKPDDDSGTDIFVRVEAIEGHLLLAIGDRVSFVRLRQHDGRLRARDVKVAE